MAPSANRRSGSSRRAQYATFFGYLTGGIGAAIGAVLLFVSLANPDFMSGLRGAGADMTAPASRGAAGVKARSSSVLEVVTGYIDAGRNNARLTRELAAAHPRLIAAEAQAEENRRLKALLGIMAEDPRPVVTTRLVGSTSTSTRRLATLGAGARQGVGIGMPVRSGYGLVGRVLEVYGNTSRVLLVTDPESVVPVRRARDGVPAFAQGGGDGTIRLRLNNLGVNPFKRGDSFVTSGAGGLYRPGTPIALVTKVTDDGAIARVLSDPAQSDYVAVDRTWQQELNVPQGPAAGDKPAGTTP